MATTPDLHRIIITSLNIYWEFFVFLLNWGGEGAVVDNGHFGGVLKTYGLRKLVFKIEVSCTV